MERRPPGGGLGRPDTRPVQVLSMGWRMCARAVRGAWRKGLGRHRLSAPAEREENSILGEGSVAGGCEKYSSRTGWGGGGSPQLPSLSNLESGAGSLRVNCGGP